MTSEELNDALLTAMVFACGDIRYMRAWSRVLGDDDEEEAAPEVTCDDVGS